MTTIAYLYSDPLLESPPDVSIWGLEVDRVYQDLGKRHSLQQLIEDCQKHPPNYLLIRRLEELGDSLEEVSDRLSELEALGIEIIATEQPYNSSQLKNAEPNDIRVNLTKLLQEIENNQRRRRIRQGHARNRIKSLPPPGKLPTDTAEVKTATSSIAVLPQWLRIFLNAFCSMVLCEGQCAI